MHWMEKFYAYPTERRCSEQKILKILAGPGQWFVVDGMICACLARGGNVTSTAVAKVETVSLTRIVQMIQVVSIWLCQQGLEDNDCSSEE